MSGALRWPPVLLAAVILQTSVLPELRVFGVAADVLLLLAVAAGVAGGPDRGAVVGFVAGALADLFVQTPFGLSALAYCLTGYAAGALHGTVLPASPLAPVATTGVGCAVGVLVFAVLGSVVGQAGLLELDVLRVALVVGLAGAVLSLVALRVVRWASAPAEALR